MVTWYTFLLNVYGQTSTKIGLLRALIVKHVDALKLALTHFVCLRFCHQFACEVGIGAL